MQIQKTNSSPNFNGTLTITTLKSPGQINTKVFKTSKAQYEEARRLINARVKDKRMQNIPRDLAQKITALIERITGEPFKRTRQQKRIMKESYSFALGHEDPNWSSFFVEFDLRNPVSTRSVRDNY